MNIVQDLINFILHVDQYLIFLIQTFGLWTYVILFGVIFAETGLVVTPFFPGDSLIFIAGAFAGSGTLNIMWLFGVFGLGAIIGDTVNYWIGHSLGRKIFHEKSKYFKKEYLVEAEKFYERHGTSTIIIARFLPIIRTFAPFVAGIGKMNYKKFITYNVVGGIAWVSLFLFAGYFFGTIPIVKGNLPLVIYGVIILTLIPAILKFTGHVLKSKKLEKESDLLSSSKI
jgi:membrane-associated protein